MNISRQNILSLLLYIPAFQAYACTYPSSILEDDQNRGKPEGKNVCGYNPSCNDEEFLNKKFGVDNWDYDENFFIKHPEVAENPSIVPIAGGAKTDTLAKTFTEVTIYTEDHMLFMDREKAGVTSLTRRCR